MRLVRKFLPLVFLFLLAGTLVAQSTSTAPDPAAQIAQLQQQVADAKGSADNAWMLVVLGAGAADDRPRPGAVLRRTGAQEERAGAP